MLERGLLLTAIFFFISGPKFEHRIGSIELVDVEGEEDDMPLFNVRPSSILNTLKQVGAVQVILLHDKSVTLPVHIDDYQPHDGDILGVVKAGQVSCFSPSLFSSCIFCAQMANISALVLT